MKRTLVLAALLATFGSTQAATVLTQWNFNSTTPDSNGNTGTLSPATGAGTALTVGGTSTTFFSGAGSTDPDTTDDSGMSISAFKAQGSGNKESGVEFRAATTGFEGIKFSFDQRNSNTGPKRSAVLYSVDSGTTWVEATTFDASAGAVWDNGRVVDLSSITALNNKADVRFRIVAAFSNAGNSAYEASASGSNYGVTGTWRFDMVTFTAEQPVPEPATMAALGLGAAAMLRRRRK